MIAANLRPGDHIAEIDADGYDVEGTVLEVMPSGNSIRVLIECYVGERELVFSPRNTRVNAQVM